MIEGDYSAASETVYPSSEIVGGKIDLYLPRARIGSGNYVYVFSPGDYSNVWVGNTKIYFGVAAVTDDGGPSGNTFVSNPIIPVFQANAIDQKVDDGLPQFGKVIALHVNTAMPGIHEWANAYDSNADIETYYFPNNAASAMSCFDNGNGGFYPAKYSTAVNDAKGPNCALSFLL